MVPIATDLRPFAISRHELPDGSAHLDLFLERDGALRAWRIPRVPAPGESVLAERNRDHRLLYLDFSGELSEGRGLVTRLERGSYAIDGEGDDEVRLRFVGRLLAGRLTLRRDRGGWVLVRSIEEEVRA